MKNIILITNILFALFLILTYFNTNISPENYKLISLLPLIYIVLLIINILYVVIWIFIKWRYCFISIVSIILGINTIASWIPLYSFFPLNKTEVENKFKIMSYNVMVFGLYTWDNNKYLKHNIIKTIADTQADIVCLQEAYWEKGKKNFVTIDSIKIYLSAKYDYRSAMTQTNKNQYFGFATISKYPIINTYSHRFENSFNGFIYTDIIKQSDTIRIYNCHLQSLQLNQNDYTVIETTTLSDNIQFKTILKKYVEATKERSLQVEIIKNNMDSCSYPIFLCGDFNDIPSSYAYNKLSSKLKDTYSYKGKFPGTTWNNFKIKQRIDYILYNSDYKCISHAVIKKKYSDHFPIVAEFYK